MQVLVDSNILVYAIIRNSPKHSRAQQFLQEYSKDLVVAQQNVFEALRVLTHPKYINPMTSSDASVAIGNLIKALNIIAPNYETYQIGINLVRKYQLRSDLVFDAYLAATALSNGIATIATDNTKDFIKIKEIKVINPFA